MFARIFRLFTPGGNQFRQRPNNTIRGLGTTIFAVNQTPFGNNNETVTPQALGYSTINNAILLKIISQRQSVWQQCSSHDFTFILRHLRPNYPNNNKIPTKLVFQKSIIAHLPKKQSRPSSNKKLALRTSKAARGRRKRDGEGATRNKT